MKFTSRAKGVVLAVLAIFSIAAGAATESSSRAPTLGDFAYGMKFKTNGDTAAFRAALPSEVYRGVVQPDLVDVAVFNVRGEVVPHVLQLSRTQTILKPLPVALPLFPIRGNDPKAMDSVRVSIQAGGMTIDAQAPAGTPAASNNQAASEPITAYVLDGRALDSPVESFVIGWPDDAAQFAGRLRVESSDDLGSWRTVVDTAPIANLRRGESRLIERRIETPVLRSKFWRLSWIGERAPFEITSVTALSAGTRTEIERPSVTLEGTPVAGKVGEFEFDACSQFPVDRVNVALPEVNSVVEVELLARASLKSEWHRVARSGFYRLQSSGEELVNGAIVVPATPDRYWLAKVDPHSSGLGNGRPKLRIAWPPHEVVFLARGGGPYTLAFGNAALTSPAGRIASLPDGAAVLSADFAARETLSGESRRTRAHDGAISRSTILWSVLGLGVTLLAYMAYRLGRELKSRPLRDQ